MIDLAHSGFTEGSTDGQRSNAIPMPINSLRPPGFAVGDRVRVVENAYDIARSGQPKLPPLPMAGYYGSVVQVDADRFGQVVSVALVGSIHGHVGNLRRYPWVFIDSELEHAD